MYAVTDEAFMARALDLAAQGTGFTEPNPRVGAVLVHEGRIIGEGYHHRAGEPHAEIMALANVRPEDLKLVAASTMYVTLEPCSHTGRTGPCSLALVQSGVRRVVVAHGDPNPHVSGRGISQLKDAGIDVLVGPGSARAAELNRAFFHSMVHGQPWITLKWAEDATGHLDGRRSTAHPGPWSITGPESGVVTHRLRQTCGALLVGTGTWLADGTRGTVRAVAGPEIPRIIWASRPLSPADAKRAAEQGWAVWGPRPGESPAEAWNAALSSCGLRGILVEGGAGVLAELLALDLWDEAYRWQSPNPLPDPGTAAPAFLGAWMHVGRYGRDELYRARRVNFT